jgi:glucose-specific phosphotransferase system IIA component
MFFKKKYYICSPIDGEVLPINEAPDPVFSEKTMGDGFCIAPANGYVYSPVDGIIGAVFKTKHAVGIQADNGLEVILHFGLDTVELNGEGFEIHVDNGDRVKVGDKIMTVNLDFVRNNAPSVITPVVITNLNGKIVELIKKGSTKAGEKVLLVK